MNARESACAWVLAVADELGRSVAAGAASTEMAILVEEQVAGGGAVLDRERGKGAGFDVRAQHSRQVDGAEDVDVMKKKGRVVG